MHTKTGALEARAPTPWGERFFAEETDTRPQGGTIDLEVVRGFLWRQRAVLVGVTLFALLLGFLATILAVPIYQATATVRVDPEQPDIFEGDSLSPNIQLNYLDSYIATLVAVVQSRSLATQVVDTLHLERDDKSAGSSAADRPAGMSSEQWFKQRREAAISNLQGGVSAKNPLGERMIEISYRSDDPAYATRIANAYADVFLTDDLRRSLQKNAYAENYLSGEIAKVRGKLDEAQRAALGYARANSIVGDSLLAGATKDNDEPATAAPQTITASNLASVNANLADARSRRIAAEQRWRTIAGAPAAALPEFQTNATAQSLQSERARVAAELSETRVRYGPDHPQVKELNAQLSSIDAQLAQVGRNIKSGLRKNYEAAAMEEQALAGELNRVSGETMGEQERRVEFNQLNGEVSALQTQLAALLDRYNQISASANVRPNTMTLLDHATQPGAPISPDLLKNLIAALVLGGGLALGIAVLRETLDDRLRSAEDVESKLGVPLLGLTPLVESDEELDGSGALAEAYFSIRAALDFALARPDHNVVQLTSSQSVEGKTTTAIALAREYARLGRRVLLVDADLRRPSISRAFDVARPKKGFAEVLSGEVEMHDALLPQPLKELDVLPVGPTPPNPVEIISSHRMAAFVERQRALYDLVIIDSPPIMGLADAPLISRYADGVVFVVESNRAHFGQAKAALRRLRHSGAPILGAVLTKFRALDAGQSYNYQYTYYSYGEGKKG